ncbi:unnamed protein product [Allacma fusca]|uniref:Ig-like domain-containing protein n=1 Tax=Allacma fusca TaxID=39272 RepID=A0A8J2LE91_9HEXA|nr:unnamed protein product [Allacma fusca]
MSPYEIINVLLLLSCLVPKTLGQQKDNNNNFKPSKDLYSSNGNLNSSNNAVNTRFFQNNFNQFYNPQAYSKFNHFFYPNVQSNPSQYHTHGNYQRQIRVPGLIEIRFRGRDAEITCEFQRYLILVQGIYWHHNIDPYGSYFDTRNGFAPHITVINIDPWKSVLTIKDYTDDDAGPYRCISTAILPDESAFSNNNNYYGYPEVRTNELEETKRKVRFTRELKEQSNFNAVYDPFLSNYLGGHVHNNVQQPAPFLNNYNHYLQHLNNNYYPNHYNHNSNNLYPATTTGFNPSTWNVHAPYYKPTYSVSIVYQEVIFPPTSSTTLSPGK